MFKTRRFLPYIITAVLVLPLLSHIYLGQYNRAMADDFCFTARAQNLGIAGTLDWWYNNWTGTYSSTFFQSITGLSGLWQFVPSVLMTLWLLAAVWAAYQFAQLVNLKRKGINAVLLGALIVYGANDGTANVFQSLYWTSGAITYTAPLIVLTFNIGVFLLALRKQSTALPYLALIGGLCMWAGGFSPLFAAFQASLFALALVVSFLFAPQHLRRTALILAGTGFAFAVTAFLILLIAPGNAIRRSRFDEPMSLTQVIGFTLYATVAFIPTSAGFLSPMALLTPLIIGGMLGLVEQPLELNGRSFIYRHRWKYIGLAALLGFILIGACFFAGIFAISTLPPARAYIVPQLALVVTVTAIGYIAGMTLQRDFGSKPSDSLALFGTAGVIVVLFLGPINVATQTLSLVPDFRTFASEWETRDDTLRSAVEQGTTTVEITPFTVDLADYADILPVEDDTHKACFTDYYNLQDLRIAGASAS
jgi:hypothetical protein